MSWFTNLFSTKVPNFPFAWLPAGNGTPPKQLKAGESYLTVKITAARIVHSRKLWKKLYPVAHTAVSVPHPSAPTATELRRVVSPADLRNVESDQLDRVIMVDQTVFGPVPYYGGELNLTAVLFGVQGGDVLKPYIGLLDRLSGLAGVQFIAQALPFAELLKEGTEQLTDLANMSKLEVAIRIGMNPPKVGRLIVVADPNGETDAATLTVTKDGKVVKPDKTTLTEHPYFVLEFVPSPDRKDFFSVPELNTRHQAFIKTLRERTEQDVRAEFETFRRYVLTCDDLLKHDQKDVISKVKTVMENVFKPGLTSSKNALRAEFLPLDKYVLKSSQVASRRPSGRTSKTR